MAKAAQDQILVERCLAGDSRAFNRLIDLYKRQVFSLIFRLVSNQADAEDIAQETFIKAYRSLASYDPSFPLLTWLFRIAHNSAIDFLRARKPDALSIDDDENPLEVEDAGESLEERLEASSQHELIERALGSLPPLYREILVLRHQQELSYEEIARSLDIPVGTVKVRIFRARDLMKQKLVKLGYG
jgi:RNA polymerase sigma-70 factor (ECF subfamily)